MAKSKVDIARQLSNDKSANGSQSVSDVAKKLNEGLGKPLTIKTPLEGSGNKGKK